MQHVDEGTIHAMLDGELALGERLEIERHLETCAECHRRADEARSFLTEADRLLVALDPTDEPAAPAAPGMPGVSGGPALEAPGTPADSPAGESGRGSEMPAYLMPPEPEDVGTDAPDDIVLIPPEPELPRYGYGAARSPLRRLGLAAALVGAIGIGWLASGVGREKPVAESRQTLTLEPGYPDAAVAPEERSPEPAALATAPAPAAAAAPAPDSDAAPPADSGAAGGGTALAAKAQTRPAQAESAPNRNASGSEAEEPPPQVALRDERDAPAADESRAADEAREERDAAARVATRRVTAQQATDRITAQQQAAARARESAPDRAAGAAAPSSAGFRGAEPAAANAPTNAPARALSPLERQAGIDMRVGLDEASRLLGGPVHAIEGLRPQFVGIVPGRDGDRPIVRAVYLDPSGRAIFLDQQRLPLRGDRARDTTFSDNRARFVKGDVSLAVQADVSEEQLRALVRRVR